MMSNRDSLRKFFAWTLVFLYQGFVSDAYAPPFYAINKDLESGVKAELPEGNNSIDYVTDQDIITQVQQSGFSESQEAASVITLCPDGQYVAACGNYRVGFNWLKSAKVPDGTTQTESPTVSTPVSHSINYKTTGNYYISNDILDLYEQMRIFFKKTEDPISILSIDEEGHIAPALYSQYSSDREAILNNVCHPRKYDRKCVPCPNGANVPKSTVELDSNNLVIQGSWDFHTFADCYMQEFEDTTGTYFYVPDNVNFDIADLDSPTTVAQCYYTNTNAIDTLNGDEIGTLVFGLYVKGATATDAVISLPTNLMVSY